MNKITRLLSLVLVVAMSLVALASMQSVRAVRAQGAVITTLPMAVIFFVFQRFFVEGVTYTGVKGWRSVISTAVFMLRDPGSGDKPPG